MRVLSFDPGLTTGWAYQDENNLLDLGSIKGHKEFSQFLGKFDREVDHVVIEDYIILQKKAMSHSGSKVPAIQIIGTIKSWCYMHDIEFTMYRANLKPIQKKVTQIQEPKGPHSNTDPIDAYRHGRYWLVKNGHSKSALEIQMEKKNAKD